MEHIDRLLELTSAKPAQTHPPLEQTVTAAAATGNPRQSSSHSWLDQLRDGLQRFSRAHGNRKANPEASQVSRG